MNVCTRIGLLLLLVASGVAVAEQPIYWRQTGSFSAPEAFQAAAADEKHFYAITNDRVAQYDRYTRKRLAVSKGDAHHLNSGFVWEGKLYCAHSNYPAKPEQSEIKVLDLESFALTTFKDFGNFGGSLTWAVQHDGHWWCNFARYGTENGQTFLVKFADDWREAGRWTYPPEVIRELGRNSLSGGLWLDGSLLVTGHDDPVLFRLGLPKQGDVLRFVGREAIPFAGQGFAFEPHTGGLIGINRASRQVVWTNATSELRVMTYNIHHGEGIDSRLDLDRIAAVIKEAEPDLVALQEVDQKVKRSGQVDQPAELARLTGMQVVFGGNIPLEGGEYGNAVLSRFPIIRHQNHLLPRTDGGEQRGVLEVELDIAGEERLIFLATHFDHRRLEAQRLDSVKAINKLIEGKEDVCMILAGDLNDTPDSKMFAELATRWKNALPEGLKTYPAESPNRQIDHVVVHPQNRWWRLGGGIRGYDGASDHCALFAVVIRRPR